MYNIEMTDDTMLDTRYLFQPRPGKAYLFRMATPPALVGRLNPRTGRPYKAEIRESIGGHRDIRAARKARDELLGRIRQEERRAVEGAMGDMETAIDTAARLRTIEDPGEQENIKDGLREYADVLEHQARRRGVKAQEARDSAARWYKVATGQRMPFAEACTNYLADPATRLAQSTVNNLRTSIKEFTEFAGPNVCLEDVDRPMVARFLTDFLPKRTSARAPNGPGAASVQRKVTLLSQVWKWAQRRGVLEDTNTTPWDGQAPGLKAIAADRTPRRPFKPEEARKLLEAAPEGAALGDAIRVALMTGVRLEEVAGLDASQVQPDASWYRVKEGKTDNAVRVVPLVGMAQEVIARRLKAAGNTGPLFGELPVRKSTGNRGGMVSKWFTKLRREVLGKETDGELALHCFRHTWRTAARRAGIGDRTIQEMGGWKSAKDTDLPYDHGLEIDQYVQAQQKVADWMRDRGYLSAPTELVAVVPPLPTSDTLAESLEDAL